MGFVDEFTLGRARSVNALKGVTLIGGVIMDINGQRVSGDEVWMFQNGGMFSISGGAQRRSISVDGNALMPISAVRHRNALERCVLAIG